MINRGTTPYHSFVLPIATDDIDQIYITYMQNGEVVVERSKEEIELIPVNIETQNSEVIDTNKGDEFSSNDSEQEEEEIMYTQATVHLTQEETLGFIFYPAAEKNIALIQIRIVDVNEEAYASEPIKERIYGVLKEGVIGGE